MLTFWSYTVFGPSEIDSLAKHNITVRYLYGPKEKCIEAAVNREAANGHAERGRSHWCEHNRTYQRMGGPGLAEYRVDVFNESEDRLSEEEIAARLEIV